MIEIPQKATNIILGDAAERDIVTARRKRMLEILWGERYLTRTGLISRVETALGKGCFGESAWEDTFYRDMRVVKRAFQSAGYEIAYSRSQDKRGYYLREQASVNPSLKRAIVGAVTEIDDHQIKITSQLQPGERVQQGISISNLANQVVAYRKSQREAAHA
ncbi:MAG: hypothetical protein U9O54_05000 [Chloroflexota bacterium]|nr:hypothetical protein [Chloroflexota bacterium]